MDGSKPPASLSPSLLARKGGARPAMRPQLGSFGNSATRDRSPDHHAWNDLGWNDMGGSAPEPAPADNTPARFADEASPSVVVSINSAAEVRAPESTPDCAEVSDTAPLSAEVLPMVRERAAPRLVSSASRRGRKSAFTLRLDTERHLKLRLACTLEGRSAQTLVTDALDRLLAEMPEIEPLAERVGKKRKS